MSDGPREAAVRATLSNRPAGTYWQLPSQQQNCFTGLFNGALKESARVFENGRFFCGKAECEWGWPGDWEALRDAGLITFHLERVDHHDGGHSHKVVWDITGKGWDVREDELKWFNELLAARNLDESQANGG